ncbi:MAG TPA: type II secretion system protein [Candidatus Wallbacteria bacterium]|nr:type II secretion system protein [Candidatus Wallbacteria bacterium]
MNLIKNVFKIKIKAGFSLVEVIIAASILAMASVSVFQLFIFTTRSTKTIYNNSVALNLAIMTMDQVNALGASKFDALTKNEIKGEKNNFAVETRISKLSNVLSLVEVTVTYKENGRDVSVPLAMLVEN